MNKQSIIDETQLLQMHEGQARQLLNMWVDDRIDLDVDLKFGHDVMIETALEELCEILDRSIRARNQQLENIENEPMDRFRRRQL